MKLKKPIFVAFALMASPLDLIPLLFAAMVAEFVATPEELAVATLVFVAIAAMLEAIWADRVATVAA